MYKLIRVRKSSKWKTSWTKWNV